MSELGVGIIIGLSVWPFMASVNILVKIIIDAISLTNNCTGDCRQGRDPCNCNPGKWEK